MDYFWFRLWNTCLESDSNANLKYVADFLFDPSVLNNKEGIAQSLAKFDLIEKKSLIGGTIKEETFTDAVGNVYYQFAFDADEDSLLRNGPLSNSTQSFLSVATNFECHQIVGLLTKINYFSSEIKA